MVLEVLASLSPGPAVFTVIAQAVRHGWRKSIWGNLGILSGNGIYFAVSALGLGTFIAAQPALYGALRWGGILYLAWLGLKALLAKPGEAGAEIRAVEGTPRALYLQALTTQLGNPKTMIFFFSFLTPFIDPHAAWPVPVQLAVFAVVSWILEFPVLLGYAVAATHGRKLLPGSKAGVWEDRIAGGFLIAAAVWLALR